MKKKQKKKKLGREEETVEREAIEGLARGQE